MDKLFCFISPRLPLIPSYYKRSNCEYGFANTISQVHILIALRAVIGLFFSDTFRPLDFLFGP